MATLTPPIPVDQRELRLGERGAGRPPQGGGDERNLALADFRRRLRRYRIGLIAGLTPVLMLFVAFTSAYIVRQNLGTWDNATSGYVLDWRALALPSLLWLNTMLLLASSVTLELARRSLAAQYAIESHRMVPRRAIRSPWLALTLVLGFGFLLGQWLAWRSLQAQGVYISTNPSSSFFYLLTGTHAAHLLGGVVALVYAAVIALGSGSLARRAIVVDVTSWYWHFMALLWVYIFVLLHVLK
jgi:cytochrome c oxidase subunit III